jgi:hypothetical protein
MARRVGLGSWRWGTRSGSAFVVLKAWSWLGALMVAKPCGDRLLVTRRPQMPGGALLLANRTPLTRCNLALGLEERDMQPLAEPLEPTGPWRKLNRPTTRNPEPITRETLIPASRPRTLPTLQPHAD